MSSEIFGGGGGHMHGVPQRDPQLELDEEVLERLRGISPEAADTFETLQNPALSKDDFFTAVDAASNRFGGNPAEQAEGLYSQVSRKVSDERQVKVKVFD